MTRAMCSVCGRRLKLVLGNGGEALVCPNCGGTVDDVETIPSYQWARSDDALRWTDRHPDSPPMVENGGHSLGFDGSQCPTTHADGSVWRCPAHRNVDRREA